MLLGGRSSIDTNCYEDALLMLREAVWVMAIDPVTCVEHANDGAQTSDVLGGVQDASLRSRRMAAGFVRP